MPDLILRISTSMTTRRALYKFSSENVKYIVIFSAKLSSEMTFGLFFCIEPCVVERIELFNSHIHISICTYAYFYIRMCVYIYVHKYIYVHMYVFIYVYVCVYK